MLDTLETKHNAILEFSEISEQKLKVLKKEIEFPIYHEVLSDCSNRLDEIFISLLIVGKKDKVHSCQILYRTILELFFTTFYLTAVLSEEKNDETALHYKMHLMISEWLSEQMGLLEKEDLINEVGTKTNFLQYVTSKFPELKDFDKSNQQEISSAIKKFQLKTIVKYLKKSVVDNEVGIFFTNVIPEYSRTSTFVHGGPYASTIVKNLSQKNERKIEIERIASISFTCVSLAKQNIFLAYKLPPDEMRSIMQEFDKIRD